MIVTPTIVRRPSSLVALWVAVGLGGLAQALVAAIGGLLATSIASESVAGLPATFGIAGAGAGALALSALTLRLGRRGALLLGLCLAIAGCLVAAAGGVLASMPALLAGSVLSGFGNAAVMLGRYAAADLGPEASRPRLMASVLVATVAGAVIGPNLLAPASAVAAAFALPHLVGPYLVAALAFAAAAGALSSGAAATVPVAAGREPGRRRAISASMGRRAVLGLVVLSLSNLIMVAVMTMAPVHLHHLGHGLPLIGLALSLHHLGMFAPSPLSAALTVRFGATRVAAGAGTVLALASLLAAAGAGDAIVLTVALLLLGIGWNLGLVSGSILLTAGLEPADRPRLEGWGEVGLAVAAASGAAASGALVAAAGYPALAIAGAATALLLVFARILTRKNANA